MGRRYVALLAYLSEHFFHQIDQCVRFDGGDGAVYALMAWLKCFAIIAVTEELKHTAFVAQCGTCSLGSGRRRASLQDLFALEIDVLRSFLGGPPLARWRRSGEHRQKRC